DGFLEIVNGLVDGTIEKRAIDTPEPSAFARGILSSQPYTFLDDAPLEERRTQAVMTRRILDVRTADELGALDADAVARVRDEAWPDPSSLEEVHEALLWMGYVADVEVRHWRPWLDDLVAAGRVARDGDRFFAVEATRDPKLVLRGRLEALGPVFVTAGSDEEALLLQLESEGSAMRARLDGRQAWCDRRLLARIQRYTLDRLRREIEPVTAAQFLRFLAAWQHVDPARRLDGPAGVAEVIQQLAGFEVPAAAWEEEILPARVRGYQREWLDQLTLSGQAVWGRLWGSSDVAVRRAPVALWPREQMDTWASLAAEVPRVEPGASASDVLAVLRARGAVFAQEIAKAARLPVATAEDGLAALVAQGRVTCDSFGGLRVLLMTPSRRRTVGSASGRWSLLELHPSAEPADAAARALFVAQVLLRRTGVVFRRTTTRERLPVPWREVARACRVLEARGEIRGGRFVAGFDGEQYALPEAVRLLREVRRQGERPLGSGILAVSAADPLNFQGILTPDARVASSADLSVRLA
ncbi:MAG: ATP-dependent DNA helicase, partial [Vicinamibacteria bacterium]